MTSPINPFENMWRQQNRVDSNGNWKGVWGREAAINGYNSWWNNLKDGWDFKDWFDPAKPFNTHHRFMGSLSFSYGMVEGQDRDNDGFLTEDEFMGLGLSAFSKEKLESLFSYIDGEAMDAQGQKIVSKDDKISHGELAAFLYMADNIGNKDQKVSQDEINSILTKLENNESVASFDNHAKSTLQARDTNNDGFVNFDDAAAPLVTETNKNLRNALQEYQNFYLNSSGRNIGGHVINMIAGGTPADGGGVNLDLNQSDGVQIDWTSISRNTVFDPLYGQYEDENFVDFKDKGADLDLEDFLNTDEIESDDAWEIGFKDGNVASFALGLLESFGGTNGVLSQEKIEQMYRDDDIELKDKKILEAIGGSDRSITAFDMYVFLKVLDKNKDGQITPTERKQFFDNINTSASRSAGFNYKADSIKTLGDLKSYISRFSDNNENNNPDDIKIDKKAYDTAFNELNEDADDEGTDFSELAESDLLNFSDAGNAVKKPLGQELKYTDSISHSDYNAAAFIDGLFSKFDEDSDNTLTTKELKVGKNSKFSKLMKVFAGDEEAGLSREDFLTFLKMADYYDDSKIDGTVSKNQMDKLVNYLNKLDEDEAMSDEFDVYADNAFTTMKSIGDFQEFYNLIKEGGDESSTNTNPFETNLDAMAQAEEDRHNYGEYIYKSYDILKQLDDNDDGIVSREEYKKVIESNANGKTDREYRKYVEEEMQKFSQIAGLGGDVTKLTVAEYAAFTAMADDGDLDPTPGEIKEFRSRAFDRRSDDYDASLQKNLKTLAQQITNSKTYKDIQDEMKEYYKELAKKEAEKEDDDKDSGQPPYNPYQNYNPYMMGGNMGGYGTNPYMMGSNMGGYGTNPYMMGGSSGFGVPQDPLLNMGMSSSGMNTWLNFGGGGSF